jgi:hypothetical protein
MTPDAFAAAYRATAEEVAAGTGIDPIALLTQWAAETAWGTVVIGFNLGNIRCSATTFCRYSSLDEFAAACVATFHNGFYNPVLAADNAVAQLAAIVQSPWSADHYGGSLSGFYNQLEAFELTPDEHAWLKAIYDQTRGPDPYGNIDEIMGRLGSYASSLPNLKSDLDAIKASGVKVDFTPVLTAIAALNAAVATLQAAVTAIKAKTDKDLA